MVDQVGLVAERPLDHAERDRALDRAHPLGECSAPVREKRRRGVEHGPQALLAIGKVDRPVGVEQCHALPSQPIEQGERCEVSEAPRRDLDRQRDPSGELADLDDRVVVAGEVDVAREGEQARSTNI